MYEKTDNFFSDKQIEIMYSDTDFLMFVNSFFSTYDAYVMGLNLTIDDSIQDEESFGLYLRIILANADELMNSIIDFERNMSFSHVDVNENVVGKIEGRLNISEYVKREPINKITHDYPCIIKKRSTITPENIYVGFIIKQVVRKFVKLRTLALKTQNISSSSEMRILQQDIRILKNFEKKYYIKECNAEIDKIIRSYATNFPYEIINVIQNRMSKGKIRRPDKYTRIFEWYKRFKNLGIALDSDIRTTLYRYASDEFSNRLFELWCLFNIKQTFVKNFGASVLSESDFFDNKDNCLFKLSMITGGYIEIYYQKGKSLYWSDDIPCSWKYVDERGNKFLRGIPDITIKYHYIYNSIVMIDLKNKIRKSGQNSEEIYKMIGYFDNFRYSLNVQYSKELVQQGCLVFRNEDKPFEEILNGDNKKIMTISVGVADDKLVNENQFKKICHYVLDVQGTNGIAAEIIGSYPSYINSGMSINDIDASVHNMIKDMFTFGNLSDSLPKCMENLKKNHFPHVWDKMDRETQNILAMAECLYEGIEPSDNADYAPICLEFCRSIEIQINKTIFRPFKTTNNVRNMARKNGNYRKMLEERDCILGECLFFFEKMESKTQPLIELKKYTMDRVARYNDFISNSIPQLRDINVNIRRKAAHTEALPYAALEKTRQTVIGIGTTSIFYILFDKR